VVPLPTTTVRVGEELFHGCTMKLVPLGLPQLPVALDPSTDWTVPATPAWEEVPWWAKTVGAPRPINAITPPTAAGVETRKELTVTRG